MFRRLRKLVFRTRKQPSTLSCLVCHEALPIAAEFRGRRLLVCGRRQCRRAFKLVMRARQ